MSSPSLSNQGSEKMASEVKAASATSDNKEEAEIEADKEKVTADSVISSRRSKKSQKLAEAFQAELEVMDQEDQLTRMQAEHEHAMKMQEAQSKLKQLKLKKKLVEQITELGDEESDGPESDSQIVDIKLPEESKQDSVKRFFDSQEKVNITEASPVQQSADPRGENNLTGIEKMADSMAQMTNAIMQQNMTSQRIAVSSQLPKLEVPVFSGNPLRYPLWNNAFSSLVDSKPLDGAMKLNYLNSYVTGEPKKVVEHYLLLGTDEAYHRARELLARRYGSGSVVSSAFSRKLKAWPRISDRDPAGLRTFADFLEQVVAAKATVGSLGILDYPQENIKMLEKLPFYMERKWRDEVDRWQTRGYGDYPPFATFADFVKRASDKANLPELAGIQRGELKTQPSRYHGKGTNQHLQGGRSFATNASPKPHGVFSSCPCCRGPHHLDDCSEFKKRSRHLKKAFFFQKRLCMGCGVADDHRVKECTQRRYCKECKGSHLTCLHLSTRPESPQTSNPRPSEEVSSKCTNVCSLPDQDGREHCMIVPVWVRHSDNPSREYLQYAILDDQSNVGFVSEGLCDKLQLQGQETELQLTTMHQSARVKSQKVTGLQVLDFNREQVIDLPACFSRKEVPASRHQIPKAEVLRKWPHLEPVASQLMPYNKSIEVSLLIGNNCTRAIRPREVLAGGDDDPYAMRTVLGWGVVGRVCQTPVQGEHGATCHKLQASESYPNFTYDTRAKEVFSPDKVLRILEQDFQETNSKGAPLSVEETRFLTILDNGIRKRDDGHLEMPLPLKSDQASFPDNKILALKRWKQLAARFRRNPKFLEDYKAFMVDVTHNYAERVPADRLTIQDGRVNYVPHTGVYHPRKPDKIRVVFDCSATYQGVSLNSHLIQGPDLMNGLLGVLCRFRKEEVAFMIDIKSMFHQFVVREEDRDLLRFFWYEGGDETKEPVEYRMKVHLFGAASSPGCCNFGLNRAADDGEEEFGSAAANFIRNDFYVDDGLSSTPTAEAAIKLLKDSQSICAQAGLKLHKIVSNSRDVLKSFPAEQRAESIQELDLDADELALERALGVSWCTENDTFKFNIEVKDKPFTRRGVLSTVSSIYDPSGFLSPVVLKGKKILQQMCRLDLDWDSLMPEGLQMEWTKWLEEIQEVQKLEIPRCFKPKDFGEIKEVEVHHFSDASQSGYGQCSYLRLINQSDRAHVSFIVGKSRVAPLKQVSIPRLELTAATVSARMSAFLREELKYSNVKEFFWTDSQVVLGYIHNEARRFHVFVANRVQMIRDHSDPNRWFYVETKVNPADDASRGLTAKHLTNDSRWLRGPEFLWMDGAFQPKQADVREIGEDDSEVKRASVLKTEGQKEFPDHLESSRFDSFSDWHHVKKAVANGLQFKERLRRKDVERSIPSNKERGRTSAVKLPTVTVQQLEVAEKKIIIKAVQKENYPEELGALQKPQTADPKCDRSKNAQLKKGSALYQLDPFLDDEGLLRVGGRLERASISREAKHPVILPRKSHISQLLIKHCHHNVQHMGRSITHNEIRQRGYWVIGGSSAVSQCISSCVKCKRLRGTLVQQKMSDLPDDRLEPSPPFAYSAVDYFGPFLIKERRSEVKRYGVLFTCLTSRSVHLETANSLSASSFINALRRFMNRRGAVRQMRSDQGTMFIGARTELREALAEMDQTLVQEYLLRNGCDWIPFKLNVPHASHMGGVWERQIQTVRRVMEPLLKSVGGQLDDEALRTFLTEAEAIINSRPLTTQNLSDSGAPEPLTPNHILTMKPKVTLPPPGVFQREDCYSRKWWRRVQYVANEFWLRWRKEYLQDLQSRQKWVRTQRNLAIGDIVISKEIDDVRSRWPLARVTEVYPSEDGLVRKVKIRMADGLLNDKGVRQRCPTELYRPVQKLVLLLPVDEQ